jgi:hypothetical protein
MDALTTQSDVKSECAEMEQAALDEIEYFFCCLDAEAENAGAMH